MVRRVSKARLDLKVRKALREHRVQPVRPVRRVLKVLQALKALKAHKASKVRLDPKVLRVKAAVCSDMLIFMRLSLPTMLHL